jgi:crotonobetainyl-CoA:carnitine CoA-transferase CaiB-like acyl-CoA transferase
VVELGQAIAVPLCGALLADMGADVIKVEPPEGEAFRHGQGTIVPGESKGFVVMNRGKRSIAIDLTRQPGVQLLHQLIDRADVLLLGLKPGDVERFELDWERLSRHNPRLISLEHVPFGPKGPYGKDGGYDVVVQGMSGLAAITGRSPSGDVPENVHPAYIDAGTAFLSAFGVASALFTRAQTGRGQRVETSLLSTAFAMGANMLHWFAATDPPVWESFHEDLAAMRSAGAGFEEQRNLYQQRLLAGAAGNIYFRHYRTADGFVSVGSLSPAISERLRSVLGVHDPNVDPDYDVGSDEGQAAMRQLVAEAEAIFRTRNTGEWLLALRDAGVPAGPLNFPTEAISDPQVEANGFIVTLEHSLFGHYKTFAPPVRMGAAPPTIARSSPLIGEHGSEILRELGIDEDRIEALVRDGVLVAREGSA